MVLFEGAEGKDTMGKLRSTLRCRVPKACGSCGWSLAYSIIFKFSYGFRKWLLDSAVQCEVVFSELHIRWHLKVLFGARTQNTNEGSLDLRNSGILTKLEMKCTGT